MCGICGFIGYHDSHLIKKMTNIMKHRGPDAEGTWESDYCSLGHVRLSILDLSNSANQPMKDDERDIVVSYNGEIYNYLSLRDRLEKKGYRFKTHCDTEIIIPAYLEYGEQFVNKLDGMFAIALHDIKKQELLLYRDPLGKKPLFYHFSDDKLFFSSELKSLLQSDYCPRSISDEAFHTYLGLQYCLTDECILRGVNKLPPASYLKYDFSGKISINKYWELINHPLPIQNGTAPAKVIENLFISAVKKRLISDVPIGVLLSGGVDSSAVTAVMSKIISTPVKTFTAGFGVADDEYPYARMVAEHVNSDHKELLISSNNIKERLSDITWFMDEPLADGGGIATFFVAEALKSHVSVILVGEGGDELFGGYSWHRLGTAPLNWAPAFIKRRVYMYLNSYAPKFISNCFKDKFFSLLKECEPENCRNDFFQKMTNFERLHLLPNSLLMKVDRMTMAFGVEARVPFLDKDLLRYVVSLPKQLRINKRIFKDSMNNYLPQAIFSRKKQGFRLPFRRWLKNDLKQFSRDVILDEHSFSSGVFGRKLLEPFFLESNSPLKKIQKEAMIWRLMIFEIWHKRLLCSQGI